jgi:hypothetical protein
VGPWTKYSLAAAASVAFAVLLVALSPDIGPWGDGLGILKALADETGVNQRAYHIGYRVLARLAVDVGTPLGLAPEAAAIHLSRVCIAIGALLCVWCARARGACAPAAFVCTALVLASPSLWFFAGVVEVHGVQFMGSAAALAIGLAAARREQPLARFGLVAVASGVALALHLSHLLMVPALIALAAPPFERRARRVWIGFAVLALLGLFVALGSYALYRASNDVAPEGWLNGVYYLGLYEHLFLQFRSGFGWFGPGEVFEFLGDQALGQGGVVWLAALAGVIGARGRERAAFVLLVATYLLVVPQAGIRERGAYFVSLFPWFVAFAAPLVRGRAGLTFACALLVPQLALGWRDLSRYAQRPDARAWAREVMAVVERPCAIYTGDMVRVDALPGAHPGFDPFQWNQQFEFTPRRNWTEKLEQPYEHALGQALTKGRLYLDAQIIGLGLEPHRLEPWQQWARDLFAPWPIELVPVEGDLVVEVRVVESKR